MHQVARAGHQRFEALRRFGGARRGLRRFDRMDVVVIRPRVIGAALSDIGRYPEVAQALFTLLEIQSNLKGTGRIVVMPPQNSVNLFLGG